MAMEHDVPAAFVPTIKDVIHRLVSGDYTGLAPEWGTTAAGALAEIVAEIARTEGASLVEIPDTAFMTAVRGAVPYDDGTGWGVDVRLWSAAGPSAYTLVLDIDTTGVTPLAHIEQLEIM
jgi:hypothetical protein